MRIYVAGKYSERDKIKLIYKELESLGHTISLDWTNHDIYPDNAPTLKLRQYAVDDVDGVLSADLVIAYLVNRHDYKGLWVEVGVALGNNKPVWLVGSAGDSCIFVNHPLIRKFVSLTELYHELKKEQGSF